MCRKKRARLRGRLRREYALAIAKDQVQGKGTRARYLVTQTRKRLSNSGVAQIAVRALAWALRALVSVLWPWLAVPTRSAARHCGRRRL